MMYAILLGTDGKYHCEGRLQDSTERWVCDTLEEAVKRMKQFADIGNHEPNLKRKHIHYFVSQQVVKQEWVEQPIPRKEGKAPKA